MAAGLFVFGGVGISNATLIDLGSGVIKETVANQYWIKDMRPFVSRTYNEQVAAIAGLNSIDASGASWKSDAWGDWRMASKSDITRLSGNTIPDILAIFVSAPNTNTEVVNSVTMTYNIISSRTDEDSPTDSSDSAGAHKDWRVYSSTPPAGSGEGVSSG